MTKLLPCPFCGSTNIDPEGWASTERAGPACDDCAGTADTVELWNKRPGVDAERERCAKIAISFGEFPGGRLVKDLRVMCGGAIADKIRETSADTSQLRPQGE